MGRWTARRGRAQAPWLVGVVVVVGLLTAGCTGAAWARARRSTDPVEQPVRGADHGHGTAACIRRDREQDRPGAQGPDAVLVPPRMSGATA